MWSHLSLQHTWAGSPVSTTLATAAQTLFHANNFLRTPKNSRRKEVQEEGGTSWLLLLARECFLRKHRDRSCRGTGGTRGPAAALWVPPGRQGRVRTLNELPPGTERTKRQVKIKSCSLERQRNFKGNLALILQSTCCSALPGCRWAALQVHTGLGKGNQKKDKRFGIQCPASSEIQSVELVL